MTTLRSAGPNAWVSDNGRVTVIKHSARKWTVKHTTSDPVTCKNQKDAIMLAQILIDTDNKVPYGH